MTAVPGDVRSIQGALAYLGWPLVPDGVVGPRTREAVADFQHIWTGAPLVVDGIAGKATCDSINYCGAIGRHVSAHFTTLEFKSKGNGWIKGNRTLIRGLERLRAAHYPNGLRIVSGYRDPAYNDHLPGAAGDSQHKYGSASDLDEVATLAQVRALGAFSGIGVQRSNGKVRHVDVRGQDSAPATTPGTTANPTVWYY